MTKSRMNIDNRTNSIDIISEIEKISREIIKNYAEIVNVKPQTNSYENGALFNDKTLYNGDQILANIDCLRNSLLNRQQQNIEKYDKIFKKDDLFFELIILEHQSLFITLIERFNHTKTEFDGINNETYTFKSVSFLCHLLNLIINNLITMQDIMKKGYNHQVNLIFRNYIELSEISIAILLNESFFNIYTSEPLSPAEINRKWKEVKPEKVHKLIGQEFQNSLDLKSPWEDYMDEIRNSLYSKTSGFVHGNSYRVLTESYSKEIDKDIYTLTSLGLISDNLRETFNEIVIYSKTYIKNVIIFLVKNHKLNFNRFEQDGRDHIFLTSVSDYMFEEFVHRIKKT